ncbi:MAG TPA: hypothetical protein VFU80_02835, partial [Sphingomicrobium sp.]|nr:hypothetical protein [Sphingomicrobium sp.]
MYAAALAMLAASLASAQPAPPAQQAPAAKEGQAEEIVVTGRLREALTRFVQRLTQAGPTDQVARWKDEICPEVYGIAENQARFVRDRIGEVAKGLRLRVGRTDCPATMYVVVTPNAAAFAAEMERLYPISLRTDGRARLKRFVTSTRPVRWISVTDECGNGCSLPNSRLMKATRPSL